MARPLVIVESPAKAKTIGRFLGPDFVVESSIGHVRDLPANAAQVPAAYKGEPWARRGVDVDNDFKPLYVVPEEKKAQVRRLKSLLGDASELYLATDEDREGESIAWHLTEVLAPRVPVKRMVFHEITPGAIEAAIAAPRAIDERLVDAQETRRILDRLYGYEVSPVLWKKVRPRLSAGRVQSVATRMIVERERERMRFRSAEWWSVAGRFEKGTQGFAAALVTVGERRVATGRDFDSSGRLSDGDAAVVLGEEGARGLAAALEETTFEVASVEERPFRRSPAAPFITSTLQQEAGRKLRFTAARTMQVAQRLYEQGYITYMRTDSTTLSETALEAARAQARALYGADSVPAAPRRYSSRVKNAQEAHEAIRPAGESFRAPGDVAREVDGDAARIYDLVWRRTLASQMADARGTTAQVRLAGATRQASAAAPAGERVEMAASGRVITFPGFLRAYAEDVDEEAERDEDSRLPALEAGERLPVRALEVEDHATKPPARYTEASLVKALEELGVGRPSTYASIIATIQDRGYVWKKGSALVPTFIAFAVVTLLERHFPALVDYGFTAAMEDELDEIASGAAERIPWLRAFYFGDDETDASGALGLELAEGLKSSVENHLDEIDAREINSVPIGADEDGREIVVRIGRYGPYVQRGEQNASIPDDITPDELTVPRAVALLEAPASDRELGTDPASGETVLLRSGPHGPYVQLGEAAAGEKVRRASLFVRMSPQTITLEEALALLSLPRVVGVEPDDGQEITAQNGKYGPYLRKSGGDSRSLDDEDQLLSVTLAEALVRFAEPKRRRQAAASSAARELGPDPETGKSVLLRAGRFGPYVTDGTTNASLRSREGDDPETITLDRALELLANRRAAGPAPSGGRSRSGAAAKKAPAKKAAAKKAPAKRAPAKKAAAKKAPAKKAMAKKAPATKTPAKKVAPASSSANGSAAPD